MGIPVLIIGESGSGKSSSLRNFKPEEVAIFNVAGKPFPFRNKFAALTVDDPRIIMAKLKQNNMNCYVIDDSQYLLVNEFFDRANEVGYQKFTDMALKFRNLIHFVINKTPDDVVVYFLHHTETDVNGKLKAKTIGKLLDEKLTVEGLFDIVLRTEIDSEGHWFRTQSDGYDTVKSPYEMFPERIPNDLAVVDTATREYYGFMPIVNNKEEKEGNKQ
jgi:hypothetical protein